MDEHAPEGNDVGARMAERERFERQASQYSFPYHWLPRDENGVWYIWRDLNWGPQYLSRLRAITGLVKASGAKRVLDLGCGDGRLAYELLTAGVDEVVGVDLAEQSIEYARAFNRAFANRARFHCVPVQALDEEGFDGATAMEVLEHIPEDQLPTVVEALWDRLRDHAPLVVTVPTTNVPVARKHERHYTLELLGAHLAPHFRIEDARYLHRQGVGAKLVRLALTNRLFVLRHPRLIRYVTRAYRRFVQPANAESGANLVVLCRREERR